MREKIIVYNIYIHTHNVHSHNTRQYLIQNTPVSGVAHVQQESDELWTGLQMFSVTSPEKQRLLITLKLTFSSQLCDSFPQLL